MHYFHQASCWWFSSDIWSKSLQNKMQVMPKSLCAESTAERGRTDHSCSVRGSFLVILAMRMTMKINSNSVLLIRAGQHESFEHVQNFCVPNTNTFHSWLCTLKTCSYLLCRTAYVLYSSHSYCILHHSCM